MRPFQFGKRLVAAFCAGVFVTLIGAAALMNDRRVAVQPDHRLCGQLRAQLLQLRDDRSPGSAGTREAVSGMRSALGCQ